MDSAHNYIERFNIVVKWTLITTLIVIVIIILIENINRQWVKYTKREFNSIDIRRGTKEYGLFTSIFSVYVTCNAAKHNSKVQNHMRIFHLLLMMNLY